MNVTLYDLIRKSSVFGWSIIVSGTASLLLQWSGEPTDTSLGEFITRENHSGEVYNIWFLMAILLGLAWLVARRSIMESLKKGMTEEQLRKIH